MSLCRRLSFEILASQVVGPNIWINSCVLVIFPMTGLMVPTAPFNLHLWALWAWDIWRSLTFGMANIRDGSLEVCMYIMNVYIYIYVRMHTKHIYELRWWISLILHELCLVVIFCQKDFLWLVTSMIAPSFDLHVLPTRFEGTITVMQKETITVSNYHGLIRPQGERTMICWRLKILTWV